MGGVLNSLCKRLAELDDKCESQLTDIMLKITQVDKESWLQLDNALDDVDLTLSHLEDSCAAASSSSSASTYTHNVIDRFPDRLGKGKGNVIKGRRQIEGSFQSNGVPWQVLFS